MSRHQRMALSMVACSPRPTGLGCLPGCGDVGLPFSSSSRGTGSGHDALHTQILEGWSSRLIDLDAEIRSRAPVRHCGSTQKVPVIEASKELGAIIKQLSEVSQHESCHGVNGSCKSTSRELASLINSTVGTDLGTRGLEVHPVRGGACVLSGQDSGKVQVVLLDVVNHSTSRDVLKSRFQVKVNQNPCWVTHRETDRQRQRLNGKCPDDVKQN